ncbi:SUMF1/EgtB/PvdO family nonheme iron enzyme [Planctomicrobium piriforme]|uniref:Formylglycine-generating enzyme, required for sulfatase activity, contains SUMF1/FGE domain n=1 Tax=Planctomicrobium piriforme TaxID=1576369 RepID=A0A1I3JY95_9PLAN|nr:SUMF1/EgtB/PvdO family nonheme iron enzyme [Planctomicrobium piriforme]SFI65222.1 Formylglycine-generating enzyme, required for sulfatase activity, contains SUMF1/FGE domain [Planctomicrobium piriforme]
MQNSSIKIRHASRIGATITEVVTVLVVIGLLSAVSTPLVLHWRSAARTNACRNNLRTLTLAMRQYHDSHQSLPPAAVWNTDATTSLALHSSKRVELITQENWAILLLPWLGQTRLLQQFDLTRPIGADENEVARGQFLRVMNCGLDDFNHADNPYELESPSAEGPVAFARGNYAINGGTHNYQFDPPSTTTPRGDLLHLVMSDSPRQYQMWGNGIAGINKSFRIDEFTNGQSTLVALEELRAGIHPLDPRGVWALGQIGGSITWGHGVNSDDFGPNHQWSRADDLLGCGTLHQVLGSEALEQERMPCVHYVDANHQATSRSLHPNGVHLSLLDGSVRFISDRIDPGLWHVMHSRETPPEVLAADFDAKLQVVNFEEKQVRPRPSSEESAPIPERLVNSIEMEFVAVPAGEFEMGTPDLNNASMAPANCPAHIVQITRPYLLGTKEVTQSQYRRVMIGSDAMNQALPPDGVAVQDAFPITNVTWNEAVDFCKRLSEMPEEQQARRSYRLPTEAQWERACRAGGSESYVWRSTRLPTDSSGEAAGINPPLPLTPVGAYDPNTYGLHDMRGNAWEWSADWFDRDYYVRGARNDPAGPAHGYLKVVRGGDWRFVGEVCHIDYPMMADWIRNQFVGFRVVCEISK